MKKITVLDGYYATGDFECFCFDQHPEPEAHYQSLEQDPLYHKWDSYKFDLSDSAQFTKEEEEILAYSPDHCRVYPDELLPAGHKFQRGKWVITVEFIPDGTED